MFFLIIPMGICGILINFYYLVEIGEKDRIGYTVDILLGILVLIMVIIVKIPQNKHGFHC